MEIEIFEFVAKSNEGLYHITSSNRRLHVLQSAEEEKVLAFISSYCTTNKCKILTIKNWVEDNVRITRYYIERPD